jgi:hypothetical protein
MVMKRQYNSVIVLFVLLAGLEPLFAININKLGSNETATKSDVDTSGSKISLLRKESKKDELALHETAGLSVFERLRNKVGSVGSQSAFLLCLTFSIELFLLYSLWTNMIAGKMVPYTNVKSFWEQSGTQIAFMAAGVYILSVFFLFEHDWERGSYFCPYYSDCIPIRTNGLNSRTDSTNRMVRIIFAGICSLAGLKFIFDFQWMWLTRYSELHPKFTLCGDLGWAIFLYVLSFVVQYSIVGLIIFSSPAGQYAFALDHTCAVFLALWCVLVHLPATLMLTTATSGPPRIAMPGFCFCAGAYVYLTWRLLVANEENFYEELLSYWLGLHVDVMCRFFFDRMTSWGIFSEGRYMIAMFVGMFSVLPPALGMVSLMWLFLSCVVFNCVLYRFRCPSEDYHENSFKDGSRWMVPDGMLCVPSYPEINSLYETAIAGMTDVRQVNKIKKQQAEMKLLLDPDNATLLQWLEEYAGRLQDEQEKRKISEQINAVKDGQKRESRMAQLLFSLLDKDGDNTLDVGEITSLLVKWQVPSHYAKGLKMATTEFGAVTLEELERGGSNIYVFGSHVACLNDFYSLRF